MALLHMRMKSSYDDMGKRPTRERGGHREREGQRENERYRELDTEGLGVTTPKEILSHYLEFLHRGVLVVFKFASHC